MADRKPDGAANPEGPASYAPPALPFLHRLPFRLGAMVLLAVLPVAALLVRDDLAARDGAIRAAGREAGRLARIAARNQEQDFERAQALLETLAGSAVVRSGTDEERGAHLRDLLPRLAGFHDLHLRAPDGAVAASALPAAASLALCDDDDRKRAVATGLPVVGNFRTGADGVPVVHLVRPLGGRGSGDGRVLCATVGIGWLASFQRNLDLAGDATLEVLDPEGTVLLRLPGGRPGSGVHPARDLFSFGEDAPVVAAGPDGARRFFGYCPLVTGGSKQGFGVVVGLPEEAVTAPLDRALRLSLGIAAGVLLLSLVGARMLAERLVLRRVNGLILATRRVASSDLSRFRARTRVCQDPSEIGDLERSFDDMARALERRAAEIEAGRGGPPPR
ncbi:MAG: HAMP domain-containing protein [Planctomycetes bacterium]|nr:HAMP domain-containing protein [Planctomycetota bacterium]